MNNGLKITAYAAVLAATFGAAYGVGGAADPVVAEKRPAGHDASGGGHDASPGGKEPGAKEAGAGDARASHEAAPAVGGLQVSEGGYTLALDTPRVTAGDRTVLRFSVLDDRGRKVTAYTREHGKELHFIVASRDLTVYRHLHPERASDGTWSVPAVLPAAGGYRAFADFKLAKPGARAVTLGADLAAAGPAKPRPLPPVSGTATVDGYEVKLAGSLRPGRAGELELNVTKAGRPVTDLQPYLGAYGHLVALRAGDLAYLHVHPDGEPGDGVTEPGPTVSFTATAPSAGAYRLFLDFRHEGEVRTAAFTVRAGGSGAADAGRGSSAPADEAGDGHAH